MYIEHSSKGTTWTKKNINTSEKKEIGISILVKVFLPFMEESM